MNRAISKLSSVVIVILVLSMAASGYYYYDYQKSHSGVVTPLTTISRQPEEARVPMKIGYGVGAGGIPVLVIEKLKLPAKYGLDIQFVQFASPVGEIETGLVAGELTAVENMGIFQVGKYRQQGIKVIAIFPTVAMGEYVFVRKDSEIKGPADFKGKTLGAPSPTYAGLPMVAAWLKEAGVDLKKDVKVKAEGPGLLVRHLETGEVDAVIVHEPFATQLTLSNKNTQLLDLKAYWRQKTGEDLYVAGYVVKEDFAQKYPEAIRRLVRMQIEVMEYIKANKDEVFANFAKESGFQDPETQKVLSQRLVNDVTGLKWDTKVLSANEKYVELYFQYFEIPSGLAKEVFTTVYVPTS